ncbi:Clp protease ClpP [Cetobacterium somerae]|uniref:head maturation protease, ClpP-related n=1 Tax=Cetobacterium somerae TaxID=188913 RepID=UPI00211EF393|nr:Clp protease ClpP [Cetobacterium somerae]
MSWWRAVKKKGNKAEILVMGDIGASWWASVNTQQIRKELAEFDDVDEITLRIDSPGGSVFAGIGLYSYLKDHKAKKKVYIDGMCASIATVIAMSGDEIYMNNASQFMIHNPWTIAMGEAKELRHDAEVLEGLKDSIINAYMTKTKLTKAELEKAMDKSTYYRAEQALEAGFITGVTHTTDAKNCLDDWDMTYSQYEKKYNNNNGLVTQKPIINNGNEEKKMTLKELQDSHPDVYNEALTAGRNEERERIKALDTLSNKANETGQEIINKAKYETFALAGAIAMDLIEKGGIASAQATPTTTHQNNTIPVDPFAARKEDAKNLGEIEDSEVKKLANQKQDIISNYIEELAGGQ